MKKQAQIEDVLLDMVFAFLLIFVGMAFSSVVVINIKNGDFGWAVFGSMSAATCFFAGYLVTKNAWSTITKKTSK